jgi:hypothetical protein
MTLPISKMRMRRTMKTKLQLEEVRSMAMVQNARTLIQPRSLIRTKKMMKRTQPI